MCRREIKLEHVLKCGRRGLSSPRVKIDPNRSPYHILQRDRVRLFVYAGALESMGRAVSRDEEVSSMIFQKIGKLYTRGALDGILRKWLPHKGDLQHIGQKTCVGEPILCGLAPLKVTQHYRTLKLLQVVTIPRV
jgi:hypothetical protein